MIFYLLFTFSQCILSKYTNTWTLQVESLVNESFIENFLSSQGYTLLGEIGHNTHNYLISNSNVAKEADSSDIDSERLFNSTNWIDSYSQQKVIQREKRGFIIPSDPFFKDMWYLLNTGQSSGPAGVDINVVPVWNKNITGKGIVISVLDDGIDYTHPDLSVNYDPLASFDFNDHDTDPKPRDEDPDNCHGTRCAGEVSAAGNNGICGVGVAFNSKVGGIRMLDGTATDALEASALGFKNDYIDIYINCWGPKDDGKTYGKPGPLASRAMEEGAKNGRKGRGSLYVWATGNGGLTDDDCNCDGYTTSIYTISIGCIGDHGLSAYYTEKCASTLAVTFNGASHREGKENKMITTDLFHKCTNEFKGTSASAPIAAGIIALALEANPNLTWRDIQYLIVHSAKITSPMDDGWKLNGAGLHYNHKFGFGRLDALSMVEMAFNWTTVAPQRKCLAYSSADHSDISMRENLEIHFTTDACAISPSVDMITSVEHVILTVSLQHRRRGDLSILLTSPSGATSQMLSSRRYDNSDEGLDDWNFMSVHFWGENPSGAWRITVTSEDSYMSRYKADKMDNEDIAERLLDASIMDSRKKWELLRMQNITFDFPYPEGVKRRNKVSSVLKSRIEHKQTHENKKSSKSFTAPIPGMVEENSSSRINSLLTANTNTNSIKSEETGTQRVQVSVGFENTDFRCVQSQTCSGVLLKWSLTLYGT